MPASVSSTSVVSSGTIPVLQLRAPLTPLISSHHSTVATSEAIGVEPSTRLAIGREAIGVPEKVSSSRRSACTAGKSLTSPNWMF